MRFPMNNVERYTALGILLPADKTDYEYETWLKFIQEEISLTVYQLI